MKKLLVIPILLLHYSVTLILLPIDILIIVLKKGVEFLSDVFESVNLSYEDYVLKPSARINAYALRIMKSDKTIKWINDSSEKLKQGKPID